MENTFAYRFFLICNTLANGMMGMQPQNFAQLMVEEVEGRWMNSQMTRYFHIADRLMSELIGNDEEWVWDEIGMWEVAEISVEQLSKDYSEFCEGRISFEVRDDVDVKDEN